MSSFLRVLLVEDHPMMRDAIVRLLSGHCVVVGTVDRGDAILAAVDKLQPEAVVMDVSMPGRSGLQVLPELRSRYPDLCAVILTSHDSVIYRDEAFRRGADGYVSKQNAPADLWPTLEAAVRVRREKLQRYATGLSVRRGTTRTRRMQLPPESST